jgi:protein-S-isoprenylcysteine O-methyltransferase Ste14
MQSGSLPWLGVVLAIRAAAQRAMGLDLGMRLLGVGFALIGVLLVHVVFAHFVFWLAGIFVTPNIHGPGTWPVLSAVLFNLGLVGIFALQHSGMARRRFKAFTGRFVAQGLARAVYVWAAVLALWLLVLLYQPIPITLWQVTHPLAQAPFWSAFVLGWAIAAAAYLSVGIPHLLGVSQALAWSRGAPQPTAPLVEGYAYRYVRSPQQLGLLLAFWSTPHMTVGQLLLAGGLTGYIFLGMALEEKDLLAEHGPAYAAYRDRIPRLIPRMGRPR